MQTLQRLRDTLGVLTRNKLAVVGVGAVTVVVVVGVDVVAGVVVIVGVAVGVVVLFATHVDVVGL